MTATQKWFVPFCLFMAAIVVSQFSFLTLCWAKSAELLSTVIQPEPRLCDAKPDVFVAQAIVCCILTEINYCGSWSG